MEVDNATADVTAEASLALGDSFYVDENYVEAVDAYAAALLVERPSETTETIHFRALSRRSAAFFHLGRFDEALEDALAAQQCFSRGVTGLRTGEGEISHKRAAMAAFSLQRFDLAQEQFVAAAQLAVLNHRDDATYREWIHRCDMKLNPTPVEEGQDVSTLADAKAQPQKPAASTVAAKSSPPQPQASSAASVAVSPTLSAAAQSSASASSRSTPKRPTMPKYQYYQSDTIMTIAILESNVKAEDLRVDFQPQRLTVILTKGGVEFTVIAGNLYDQVDVSRCKVQIRDEKVLLKLRKVTAREWHELFSKKAVADEDAAATSSSTTTSKIIPETEVPKVDTSKPRPYSSHRDWDKIENSLKEQEKKEIPEGDEALNKLFRDIYSKSDEDTRRAMIKSFQTSGGTVLSTNWNEVAAKDYEKERTAPRDMEWKTWEGEKLSTKDDD